MVYTTVDLVRSELKGIDITNEAYPSESDIETWMEEYEALIDDVSGTSFQTTTVTDEYIDYDGSGYVYTKHYPIISVISLYYDDEYVGGETTDWIQMTEGRDKTKDFIVIKDKGKILFHANTNNHYPRAGVERIKVTYTYGKSTVPKPIQRLATLMVARKYLETIANDEAINGGTLSVGPINVGEVLPSLQNRIDKMAVEIESLWQNIGKFKTYRFQW